MESQELAKQIKKYAGSKLTEINPFDVYMGTGIEPNQKSISFKLVFSDKEKTLNDEEINGILNKIIEGLEKNSNAEIRK